METLEEMIVKHPFWPGAVVGLDYAIAILHDGQSTIYNPDSDVYKTAKLIPGASQARGKTPQEDTAHVVKVMAASDALGADGLPADTRGDVAEIEFLALRRARGATPPPRRFHRRQHLSGMGLGASGCQQPAERGHPGSRLQVFQRHLRQIRSKYPGRQIVVTETGWPTTFGPIGSQQFPVGISNARDYLQRVTHAQQVVLYIHNIFDDQYGVDTSSPFNYRFGLIDAADKPKGILF
jgi:hypothetical protein